MGDGRILHTAALRVRVTGNGNLRMQLQGFDEILVKELLPLVMKSTNAYEMLRLTNYKSPETRVKVYTTARGERFRINRITVFVKPLWQEIPA